jgi:hypothetical protein
VLTLKKKRLGYSWWQVGLGCWFVVVLASCASSNSPSNLIQSDALLYPEEVASALLMDESLAQQLEIQDQGFVRGTDRVLLAQGYLFNKTTQPLEVEVRTLFKNTRGETLEISPWKKVLLPSGARVLQAAPSINPMVTRYLLEIRRA